MRISGKAFVLATLVGGCAMQSSFTSGGHARTSSQPATANDSASSGIHGALVRSQLDPVRGMTIDDAKAYLRSVGHDGEVSLREQYHFSDSCGVGKVCDVQPESGTGIHDRIELVINPGANADVSLPP